MPVRIGVIELLRLFFCLKKNLIAYVCWAVVALVAIVAVTVAVAAAVAAMVAAAGQWRRQRWQ